MLKSIIWANRQRAAARSKSTQSPSQSPFYCLDKARASPRQAYGTRLFKQQSRISRRLTTRLLLMLVRTPNCLDVPPFLTCILHPVFIIEAVIPSDAPFTHPSLSSSSSSSSSSACSSSSCITVARRYSDFVNLLDQLRASHQPEPVAAEALLLPLLPPKRLNGGEQALKSTADARRLQLEDFIQVRALYRTLLLLLAPVTAGAGARS